MIELFQCSFKPDTRYERLYARVKQYYADTERLDNRQAMVKHKELKSWIKLIGYSNDEYNAIKRRVSGEL